MEVNSSEGGGELGLGFPVWIAARRRFKPDDPFFGAGNIERELIAKHVALDLTEDERFQLQKMEDADSTFNCPIVGCGAHLSCLEDFEDHYHARHTASCSVCSRIYPTSRLLSIHISEAHDSFFQAKVARGFPMYECLVEGCGIKLKSYRSRQQHLVDKHQFPTSFEFFKKARPSKRHRQKHQSKKAGGHWKEARNTDMEVDENTSLRSSQKCRLRQAGQKAEEEGMEIEGKIDELVSAVSKLSTSESTPSRVSFGHRHARGFSFLPRTVRQNAKPVPQPESKV